MALTEDAFFQRVVDLLDKGAEPLIAADASLEEWQACRAGLLLWIDAVDSAYAVEQEESAHISKCSTLNTPSRPTNLPQCTHGMPGKYG